MSQFHSLTIKDVCPETDDSVVLEFEVPDALQSVFAFEAGQYLTLSAKIDDNEVRRSYSICSSPIENRLRVAVKRIDGGVFSNWVHANLRAGDAVEVMPPAGQFVFKPEPARAARYMCIAAGSGITPVLSIVRTILENEPNSQVTLIYGNQRTSTIMFREELGFLKNRFMQRLNWINVLSREEQDAQVLHGRIDNRKGAELQTKHLISIAANDEFYLCGPEAMISEVSRGLRAEQIDESRIHYELFYSNAQDAEEVVRKHHERAARLGGKSCEVSVTIDGRTTRFELGAAGENILDAAIDAGMDMPYACKGGVCATCKAKVIEGEVEMDINHALGEDEVKAGYVLTCQAHPLSDRVAVDFDQI